MTARSIVQGYGYGYGVPLLRPPLCMIGAQWRRCMIAAACLVRVTVHGQHGDDRIWSIGPLQTARLVVFTW